MRVPRAVALSAAVAVVLVPAVAPETRGDEKPLRGFSAQSSAAQRALETRFDAQLNASNLRAWLKRLAARPHAVGSPYGKDNADSLLGQFRSWGYDTRIETFDVLFPTPKTRLLEMTAPTRFVAPAGRADAEGRRHLRPGRGAAPHLPRLLDRRRRGSAPSST